MRSLIEEHAYARKTVNSPESAERALIIDETQSSQNIIKLLKELVESSLMHIEKEEGRFFHQYLQYLSKQELENTLQEFSDFDRKMTHMKYQQIVENGK
jgi:hemerythrin-like domain-containing protein